MNEVEHLTAANDRLEDVITDLNRLVSDYCAKIEELERKPNLAEDAHITLSRAFR